MRSHLTVLLAFFMALAVPSLSAHEIKPIVSTLELGANEQFQLKIELNAEALFAGLRPEHKESENHPLEKTYKVLRQLNSDALRVEVSGELNKLLAAITLKFEGKPAKLSLNRIDIPAAGDQSKPRITTLYLQGIIPVEAKNFSWKLAAEFGGNVVKVRRVVGEPGLFWLRAGASLPPMAIEGNVEVASLQETTFQYVEQGYIHILPMGVDHILFVLGLFLLSPKMKPLLIQVTLFTLAHSVTLGLAAAGIVSLPASIVEPLIAISISYVAVENLMAHKLGRFRMFVVMLFGLLHGLGFASVLSEVGLPEAQFLPALLSFNIGVEFGQLTVILVAYLLLAVWKGGENRLFYTVQKPASLLIALVGLYWFIERIGVIEQLQSGSLI